MADTQMPESNDLLPALKKQYPQIDFSKFIALNNSEFSSYKISADMGISQSMAWRIQQRLNKANIIITDFRDRKVDYLLTAQYQAIELQAKTVEYFLVDSNFARLKDFEKIKLLQAMNNIAGTLEDKQQVIINVKGNAQFNTVNLSPDEISQLQGNTSKQILDNLLITPSVSGGRDDKTGDKKPDNE